MDEDFLLYTPTAKKLFFDYAKDLPIYDYHCHLDPKEIYENRRYENLTQLWLGGDHYKWRQMRICGIDENLITGNAPDREKFYAFASIMPKIIGNPLYHWAHLELQRYFDIHTPLSPDTAEEIYNKTEQLLKDDKYTSQNFITMSNVNVVCTTDDPSDDLKYHRLIKDSGFKTKVLPTFRPDKALNITLPTFKAYIKSLSPDINSATDVLNYLYKKADFFKSAGCVISDHAFTHVPYSRCSEGEANDIFVKKMANKSITADEAEKYMTFMFIRLCEKYYDLNWAVQIHIGALRNNNTKMFEKLGPDTGYDSICETHSAEKLSKLLDSCAKIDKLPKTILYALEPAANYVLSSMIGNFSSDIPGKIQYGAAWWFFDHYEGMIRHAKDLASLGSFGTFIGMLTDSRSLLSYPRHEYFRRIICNIIGDWVESGQYPYDEKALKDLVEGICCKNIINYLGF